MASGDRTEWPASSSRATGCALCGGAHSATEVCLGTGQEATGGTVALGPAPLPADGPDELLGTQVGNFRIVKSLGRGGMGAVYLGEHAVIGSKVAVKFLHPYLASDKVLVERFFAEARAANLIGHENIVSVFDLNLLPPNRYYLVMEYLEGRPLSALVGTPIAPEVCIPVLAQACDALQAAHEVKVIHRDLKPENIFLVKRAGREDLVKLVDFGIAKLGESPSGITSAGLAVGTPEYMAPEQWTGEPLDGRADLYALGVISYLLATGRLPFFEAAPLAYWLAHKEKVPPPPRQLNPALSEAFEKVIQRALAKKREERYQSGRELKAALLSVLASPAPPPPVRPPAPQPEAPRHQAKIEALVSWPGLGAPRRLSTADLSRGGVFLCAEPPLPGLFSRVKVSLQAGGSQALECEGDVVRHVSADQAQAWGMSPGFAVQFVGATRSFQESVERLVRGAPLAEPATPRSLADDPKAEAVLEFYRRRISGDHYALLGVAADAECSEVRSRVRQATAELEALLKGPLSEGQQKQVKAALERLQAAVQVLGSPVPRAEYDAVRGNFAGVARCLSAGMTISQLEQLRRAFVTQNPKAEGASRVKLVTANAHFAASETREALHVLEEALRGDPLNIELHQRYWGLKRSPGSGQAPSKRGPKT